MEAYVAEEAKKVAAAIPDYLDPKKGEKVRAELRSYAKNLGYSDEELANAIFELPSTRQTILYHHASAGFPVKETLKELNQINISNLSI